MKLYSYQGRQWVIQGEFASELGVDRHTLERETRQRSFSVSHVIVLRDRNRQIFLNANGTKRAGGKIALIDKAGAAQLEAKFKNLPVQTKLPFPAPATGGKDRLQIITATFRGEARAFIDLNGQRCVPSPILGRLLGYRPPSELTTLVRREWGSEFVERVDYALLTGENLNDFKACVKSMGLTHAVRPRTPALLVLFESGVHKVLLKTNRPDGVLIRDFLAKEVMPALSREQPAQPKTFFLNEQHEVKAAPPTGMVTGGLSDRGAERFHQAIVLNTSFALADKLVQTGQLGNNDVTAVQVALVKEFGGVDIFGMARVLAPKPEPATVTHPAPPAKIPRPKQDMLPTVKVGEEWTLATTDEEVYTIGEASQKLRQETGRPITVQVLQKLAQDLKIHIHYDTKPRSRTSAGVPYLRMSDFFRIRRYLAENPNVFPAL